MTFILAILLFSILCGWLDLRIDAPNNTGAK
jgi:hypothetical protein